MTQIVCIHGIAQEFKSREILLGEWGPALRGGVSLAGGRLDDGEFDMAFYGSLFRPEGGALKGDASIPEFTPGDADHPIEQAVLRDLYEASIAIAPESDTAEAKGRMTGGMLQVVARTPFFGGVAQKVVIWALKQVRRYVSDPVLNAAARKALLDAISDDTRVVVSHSLGSVVAWETLCAHPALKVHTLITVGSPLGIPALLPRLDPPVVKTPGPWPGGLTRWVNVADKYDVVALEKRLARLYGNRVEDYFVDNGATMHDISPYLTSREVGQAIRSALG